MARVPAIIPVTDLRQDAAAVLKRIRKSPDPVFITQRGRPAAVLLSIDSFERSEQERLLLRSLARGDKEIANAQGIDLDTVLREADLLLRNAD